MSRYRMSGYCLEDMCRKSVELGVSLVWEDRVLTGQGVRRTRHVAKVVGVIGQRVTLRFKGGRTEDVPRLFVESLVNNLGKNTLAVGCLA